jgi:hypothetical protein
VLDEAGCRRGTKIRPHYDHTLTSCYDWERHGRLTNSVLPPPMSFFSFHLLFLRDDNIAGNEENGRLEKVRHSAAPNTV